MHGNVKAPAFGWFLAMDRIKERHRLPPHLQPPRLHFGLATLAYRLQVILPKGISALLRFVLRKRLIGPGLVFQSGANRSIDG
jgi:hypothetical protein